MGRNRVENPIKQKISFSCSKSYKERVERLSDAMAKRTFSEAMREIVKAGVLQLEKDYDLSQMNLFGEDNFERRAR